MIALTATATPLVQDDIIAQLGLGEPARFIHGFRRDNIADRGGGGGARAIARELVASCCGMPRARPAIVYAPTRKQAEAVAPRTEAAISGGRLPRRPAMPTRRKRVQDGFLAGKLEVIGSHHRVRHGHRQAGYPHRHSHRSAGSARSLLPGDRPRGPRRSAIRAVLMHSYADRFTHDFFFDRDYPDVSVLETIYARLGDEARPKEMVQSRCRMDPDVFDKALEKLWIHGGAVVDAAENLKRGGEGWRESTWRRRSTSWRRSS